jgi:methionyl-tRNA formyltransferase
MRVVYMGTPDFAVPSLQALHDAGYEISYVVTQPDAVSGRGHKVRFSEVKTKALELGLEVLQPERIKGDREFEDAMIKAAPDLIVVAAFGQILPKSILDIPKYGCINVHGSLLPRFRGAAPIQRSIIEGDEETGVTIMYMEEGLDTGNMLSKVSTPILDKTGEELHDELAELGAKLLIDTIPDLVAGKLGDGEKQDDEKSCYASMISKKDGEIDFSVGAARIARTIRAFDPWPGTYTNLGDKMIKFWKGSATGTSTDKPDGTVVGVSPEGLDIAAAGEVLRVSEIQVPGKKRVAISEYLKGNSIEIGTVLG